MKQIKKNKILSVTLSLILASTFFICEKPINTQANDVSGSFNVLSLNVAGLPELLSSSDPETNTILMSPLLNNYDFVSVQEDFAYHDDLIEYDYHPYKTDTSGNVPFGDGMNFMSNFSLHNTTRITWDLSSGIITDGSDELTPKGILYSSIEIADGYYIDVYDIHADAGSSEDSYAARCSNMEQLAQVIEERSEGKAVIVIGDTNSRYTRAEDNFEEAVLETCGLTDAWIQLVRNGDIPEDGDALMDASDLNGENYEVVDKIWYRSGTNIDLNAISYSLLESEFTDSEGNQLSDHYPITTEFNYTLKENIKYSDTYGGAGGTGFSFIEEMGDSSPTSVSIRSGSRLDSISFTYEDVVATAGGTGGTESNLDLQDGEYITSMELSKAKKDLLGTYRISYIKLTTNLGNTLEGGTKGDTVIYEAPEGYEIAGVYGCSADEIDRLGAIYKIIS